MSKIVARFERVAEKEFDRWIGESIEEICIDDPFNRRMVGTPKFTKDVIEDLKDHLKMPRRATDGSAGYDFMSPVNMELLPGFTYLIPTFMKCKIDPGYVLKLYPRSGQGFKYILRLANSTGIIDSDYYNNPKNDGHIMAKIIVERRCLIELNKGFMQGILEKYYLAEGDDEVEKAIRVGGMGSSDKVNAQNLAPAT